MDGSSSRRVSEIVGYHHPDVSSLPKGQRRRRYVEAAENLNQHLSELDVDHLYHIGMDSDMPLEDMFGDVRCVCVGGSATRMESFANLLAKEADVPLPTGTALTNLSSTDRYSLFKVGPVLSVSHGIGGPSISIMLHEVTKLLMYAGVSLGSVSFIRIGTSGGLGVPPGSVVVSDKVFNAALEPWHEVVAVGRREKRATDLDQKLAELIMTSSGDDIEAIHASTMACDDFYEAQGRLDGVFCDYTDEDKMAFLKKAHDKGIRNIEMESAAFAAFCLKAGVHGAVVCATLVNRLDLDQLAAPKEELHSFSLRSQNVVVRYLKRHIFPAWRERMTAVPKAEMHPAV